MDKLDLKRELKFLYGPPFGVVVEVEVPPINYLMIDGEGDPNTSQEYREAVETLFPVAYALKFAVKKPGGPDYAVMPLEGLWWTKGNKPFTPADRKGWSWTAMIAQPSMVTKHLLDSVVTK